MRRFGAALVTLGILAACDSIVARPITNAPVNACPQHPCSAYDADAGAAGTAVCNPKGQCEVTSAGNRPAYPFWIVVSLPDTSIFAPGLTDVFFSDDRGDPAFERTATTPVSCDPSAPLRCLQISNDASFSGTYTATATATATIRNTLVTLHDTTTVAPIASLTADQTIPVRVLFTPTGNTQYSNLQLLPVEPLVAASGTNFKAVPGSANEYSRVLLAGTYTRELYPEPPFDALYPPTIQQISFASAGSVRNDLSLVVSEPNEVLPASSQALDVGTGTCATDGPDPRCATVTREDGLDGWRVWIQDHATPRRVSVLRTLSHPPVGRHASVVTTATVLLYTATGGASNIDYDAIVAPPVGTIGVPRLETSLFGGTQGLATLAVPTIPPPVTVQGVVAEPGDAGALLGYAAKVTLVSTALTTNVTAVPSSLLKYETTVSTDDHGRFATVLPPGNYNATVEPAIGTGFAKATTAVVVDNLTVSALTLQPPVRPVLHGRAMLTDGRALGEATVIAEPRTDTDGTLGRPGRSLTADDGTYAIELDPGLYVLSVLPKAGTGFPNVVTSLTVGIDSATIPDLRIPPPTLLSFTLRDPNATSNAIVRAVVRIFASLPGNSTPVEIGTAMTDTNGLVQIPLAPQPQ